jgi:hypothetical protein
MGRKEEFRQSSHFGVIRLLIGLEPCVAGENGTLRAVLEPYPVAVAGAVSVLSDPVRFMTCDS